MRNLSEPVDDLDLIDTMDTRAQSPVHAKYLVVDHDGESEKIKHVREVVPNVGVAIFAIALGVETIGLCYTAGLVIAADQVHAGWVAQFEADEEGDCFDGEEAAVYVIAWKEEKEVNVSASIVLRSVDSFSRLDQNTLRKVFFVEHASTARGRLTQEKIIGVRTEASNLEYLNHIKELAVYVSNHCDRGGDMYNIALLHEKLFCFGAYCLYDRVRQQLFLVESLDTFIEINAC